MLNSQSVKTSVTIGVLRQTQVHFFPVLICLDNTCLWSGSHVAMLSVFISYNDALREYSCGTWVSQLGVDAEQASSAYVCLALL